MGIAQIQTGNMIFRLYMSLFFNLYCLLLGVQFLKEKQLKKGIITIVFSSICLAIILFAILRFSFL